MTDDHLGYPEYGYMESLRPREYRVIDRVAPVRRVRRRVFDDFQAAMRPSPKPDTGRWWTKERVAAIVFLGSVLGLIILVWSVMAVRMMGEG